MQSALQTTSPGTNIFQLQDLIQRLQSDVIFCEKLIAIVVPELGRGLIFSLHISYFDTVLEATSPLINIYPLRSKKMFMV